MNMKSIDQMTSEELFELAKSRQAEESEKEKEAAREQLEALREQRRALIAQQKKELAAIDAEIKKLGGKTRGRAQGSRGSSITDQVMSIVADGEISTKDIKNKLAADGIEAKNLSQTLAYLKRQGKITSPGRSMYAPA